MRITRGGILELQREAGVTAEYQTGCASGCRVPSSLREG